MSSTLGIYVENNLIKYAKVSKSNDIIKVEAFGMKFYDKFEDAIKQIIEETYSYKIPISVNLSDEIYNYFDVFGQLNKKDIDGIIKTNFENYCYDNNINRESYEQRYILTPSPESKEKIRAIHIATPKTSIARRKNQFTGYRIDNICPISVTVANLVKQNKKRNCVIVNIEDKTTITKIVNESIKDIKVLQYGAKEILEKINSKENSYTKAYEICKNTTIYTNEAKDLQIEENEYLEDIMPTLYNIVTDVRQVVNESLDAIETVYITGTLSVINNIDIYFQEYLKSTKCEILKPYFINNNSKINMKDYIEVNSAIALALQEIDTKIKGINFIPKSEAKKIFSDLNMKMALPKMNEVDFHNLFDKHFNIFNTATFISVFMLIIYFIGTLSINRMLNQKNTEVQNAISDANIKIQEIQEYNSKLNNRISKYKTKISKIEKNNDKIAEDKRYRNTIPNLMNNIMAIIPKQVNLVSIENANDTHVVIKATSSKYEQLAFFRTKIKSEGILNNLISDTGVYSGSAITITIEGELP